MIYRKKNVLIKSNPVQFYKERTEKNYKEWWYGFNADFRQVLLTRSSGDKYQGKHATKKIIKRYINKMIWLIKKVFLIDKI